MNWETEESWLERQEEIERFERGRAGFREDNGEFRYADETGGKHLRPAV